MSDTHRTVPIEEVRQRSLEVLCPELVLDGARFRGGSAEEHPHWVVRADTVCVVGACRLPGKTIDLRARLITSESGEIDVSGGAPEPDFDPSAATPELDGNASAPNGKPGEAGGPGVSGGTIEITASQVRGALTLSVDGGRGGDGQRGGDGAKPDPPAPARDGYFKKPGKGKVDGWGPWGGKRLQGGGVSFRGLLQIAYGEPGTVGLAGGAAGAPGPPGKGGDGGTIRARVSKGVEELVLSADPGAGGSPGEEALPGAGGDPGRGGRHRAEWWHLTQKYRAEYLDSLDHLKWARKSYPGATKQHRAADGPSPGPAGEVPTPPEVAGPGDPGATDVGPVEPDTLVPLFTSEYVQMLETQRDLSRDRQDDARERQIGEWLDTVTAP